MSETPTGLLRRVALRSGLRCRFPPWFLPGLSSVAAIIFSPVCREMMLSPIAFRIAVFSAESRWARATWASEAARPVAGSRSCKSLAAELASIDSPEKPRRKRQRQVALSFYWMSGVDQALSDIPFDRPAEARRSFERIAARSTPEDLDRLAKLLHDSPDPDAGLSGVDRFTMASGETADLFSAENRLSAAIRLFSHSSYLTENSSEEPRVAFLVPR